MSTMALERLLVLSNHWSKFPFPPEKVLARVGFRVISYNFYTIFDNEQTTACSLSSCIDST